MPNNKIQDYIFYKIVCLDNSCNELCYVGSTANWKARNRCHKYDCTNENSKSYNSKKYQTIREHGGWDNFKMVEIGKAEQLTKRQAEMVEEEYRQELRANMNSQRCYLTDEIKREHDKRYREDNKDKILEQNRQYNQNNKDKIKQYQLNNRDIIEERRGEKITCECGCELRRDCLLKHQKTKKHLKLMEVVQK